MTRRRTRNKLRAGILRAAGFVAICTGLHCAIADEARVAEPLTKEAYATVKDKKGIVLLAVRWDRRWKCGGYQNAQLRAVGFDKSPSKKSSDADAPDLLLDGAPEIVNKADFSNYAFLVDPGEYELSGFQIKVARSVSDVGYLTVPRSKLMKNGRSAGGSFTVSAAEIVFIGNFYLDCYRTPTLWRYHSDGREAFEQHLAEFKKAFPMLDTSRAKFRLFETKLFGEPYQLP